MRELPEEAFRLCRRTPLIFQPTLGCLTKLESLQQTGSFKLRGAAVKLARLGTPQRAQGVVAASAGNHGLGVALAAKQLGMTATIVVSKSAARVKREGIARLGAEILVEGDGYDEADRFARALAQKRGRVFVSAFDDEDVIDGNGRWLAQEIMEQAPTLRRLIVPLGGGGLIGGLASVLAPRGVRVVGVQPRANCAMYQSLEEGRALTVYQGAATLCGGLEGAVSKRTFDLVRAHVAEIVLVEEDEVLAAMAFAYRSLGLVVEPSGVVAIAAVRAGKLTVGEDTALLVSGGNVDPELVDRALAA